MKEESQFTNDTAKYASGTYAASPTDPLYVAEIPQLKFQSGKEPLETLEAQYWNWIWKIATKNINAFVDYLDDLYSELNNLLTEFGVTPSGLTATQLADMFKSEYAVTFLGTKYFSLNGGTVDGDVHVKGDLTVDGIGEEIISTELKVGADTITLRNGNPSAMSSAELAGVITENYDGNGNNNILAIDSNGTARVGDIDIATRLLYSNDGTSFFEDEALTVPATIGQNETVRDTGNTTSGGVEIYEGTTFSNDNTEAIATRENTPANGGVARWNDTAKRFDAVVPDATPTANSQNLVTSGGVFAAMQSTFPVGAVMPFAGASAPQGFLLCDGHSYAPTDPLYANLFSVIGTTYGGDGTTTFKVPDLRETVPVGVGTRGSGVAQHDTYTLGQFKDDQNKRHAHTVYVKDLGHKHTTSFYAVNINESGFTTYYPSQGYKEGIITINEDHANIAVNADNSNEKTNTTALSGGDVARGKRLGMNYIIKY